jgi:hypothetical protein
LAKSATAEKEEVTNMADNGIPSGDPEPVLEQWTYIGWRIVNHVTGELGMAWLDPLNEVRFFSTSRGMPRFTVGASYTLPITRHPNDRLTAHLGKSRFVIREGDDNRVLSWQVEDRAAVALAARIRLAKKTAEHEIEEALEPIAALYRTGRRREERQAILAAVIEIITG